MELMHRMKADNIFSPSYSGVNPAGRDAILQAERGFN